MATRTKSQKILGRLDQVAAAALQREGYLAVRRVLLDGVRIVKPWRASLHLGHKERKGYDEPAIAHEIAVMDLWMKIARQTAKALKRAAEG